MSQGQIVQCIGAVVDIQFPRDAMPKVYDALTLDDLNDAHQDLERTRARLQKQLDALA